MLLLLYRPSRTDGTFRAWPEKNIEKNIKINMIFYEEYFSVQRMKYALKTCEKVCRTFLGAF